MAAAPNKELSIMSVSRHCTVCTQYHKMPDTKGDKMEYVASSRSCKALHDSNQGIVLGLSAGHLEGAKFGQGIRVGEHDEERVQGL